MARKTFPAYPAHAQPVILSIWYEARRFKFGCVSNHYILGKSIVICQDYIDFFLWYRIVVTCCYVCDARYPSKPCQSLHEFFTWFSYFVRMKWYPFAYRFMINMFRKGVIKSCCNLPGCQIGIYLDILVLRTNGFRHDDVIKWKHFPRNWPFVRGIHRSRWIPHAKASDAELWCFLWTASE